MSRLMRNNKGFPNNKLENIEINLLGLHSDRIPGPITAPKLRSSSYEAPDVVGIQNLDSFSSAGVEITIQNYRTQEQQDKSKQIENNFEEFPAAELLERSELQAYKDVVALQPPDAAHDEGWLPFLAEFFFELIHHVYHHIPSPSNIRQWCRNADWVDFLSILTPVIYAMCILDCQRRLGQRYKEFGFGYGGGLNIVGLSEAGIGGIGVSNTVLVGTQETGMGVQVFQAQRDLIWTLRQQRERLEPVDLSFS